MLKLITFRLLAAAEEQGFSRYQICKATGQIDSGLQSSLSKLLNGQIDTINPLAFDRLCRNLLTIGAVSLEQMVAIIAQAAGDWLRQD